MNKTVIAKDPYETEEIGIELAESLKDGMVVSLIGSLGAGKTTFAKGLAKGLLITDVVVSPSYVIARTYQGRIPMHHIDAYRVSSLDELEESGLTEYLPPERGVSIVEWPERIDGLVEASTIEVRFELMEDHARRIHISRR